MTHDEAEFLISQRLDGTLDAADAERLRAAIDADAIVAAMWREHQALDAALRASQVAVDSTVEHQEQVARIAAAIDDHDEASSRTIKLSAFNWRMPLAAAAMLAIGLSVGILSQRGGKSPAIAERPHPIDNTPVSNAVATIQTITLGGSDGGNASTIAPTAAVADVTVGTPADLTPAAVASLYVNNRFGTAADRIVIEAAGRQHQPDTFE